MAARRRRRDPRLRRRTPARTAWDAYERAVAERRVTPDAEPTEADPLPGRTLNPHFTVPEIDALLRDADLVEIVSVLLGAQALPFQTIMGHKASEQPAHSDAIHMTTYPLGYLAAAWLAFEDISPELGAAGVLSRLAPLAVRVLRRRRDLDRRLSQRGYGPYAQRYEPRIAALIEEHGLQRARSRRARATCCCGTAT